MEEIQYIGEHLLPGKIGHLSIVLSFASVLFAAIAYILSFRTRSENRASWKKLGRLLFGIHGLSVFSLIAMLFYVMYHRYYEYSYVFQHVSDDLPMRYLLSAFWEGQEGSFLLWMFWHILMGAILLRKGGKWEGPVMAVLCLVQIFLASMLLGLHVPIGEAGFKLGSNPSLLLRETMDAPIFANADYLQLIQGQGLNILLQNYWMTIHPPTLFLGFASVTIPFAFAMGGLLSKDPVDWLRPVYPWALFSAGILGTGILMGAAWAYEALTFGGYWAWDPVENMSLVPWLMLIGGMHANLIAKNTGNAIRSTFLFYIGSFLLILYSTYMTRSGILQDTSAHAFTEMGLSAQLIAFILFFFLLAAVYMAIRWKEIPAPKEEEPANSREFWMFIGALVLVISSFLITYSTSLPVINRIIQSINPDFRPMVIEDVEGHYNRYQLWVALLMAILSGIAIYLRYGAVHWEKRVKKIKTRLAGNFLVSVAISFLLAQLIPDAAWQHYLLLFGAVFVLGANLDYLINFIRFRLKASGVAFSHIGFGLLILGILISGISKQYITFNPLVQRGLVEGFDEQEEMTNLLLIKNSPLYTQGYEATYVSDTLVKQTRTYSVRFKGKDPDKAGEEFILRPNVIFTKDMSELAAFNPSIIRGWKQDIFSRISGLPQAETNLELARAIEDSLQYDRYFLRHGDTLRAKDHYLILKGIELDPKIPDFNDADLVLQADIVIGDLETGIETEVRPSIALMGSLAYQLPEQVNEQGVRIKLNDSILIPFLYPQVLSGSEIRTLLEGESMTYQGMNIRLGAYQRKVRHPHYHPQDGDITVGARLYVEASGQKDTVEAVYFIRNSREYHADAFIPRLNLSLRFRKLHPEDGSMELELKRWSDEAYGFPVYLAEDSPRTDFISLEAVIFPGINLVWLGSILMMAGMFLSWWYKRKVKIGNKN